MIDPAERVIYQLKVVLLGISPMIWRRVKVSSDSTIEDLHYTIQLAMGWEDIQEHHFIIHGKQYGIIQPGGTVFSDAAQQPLRERACEVKLSSLGLREKEKFLYEYDFSICPLMGAWRYWWRHQIRVEAILTPDSNQTYPICTDGKCRAANYLTRAKDYLSPIKILLYRLFKQFLQLHGSNPKN
ncbi:MAG: plasmid pRiA4b ORF-3 family protein [Fischerella sp. CENA71]|nr:plasmid pRiA4b ORF-3 family protein [Fischerella sp. CENA71]